MASQRSFSAKVNDKQDSNRDDLNNSEHGISKTEEAIEHEKETLGKQIEMSADDVKIEEIAKTD